MDKLQDYILKNNKKIAESSLIQYLKQIKKILNEIVDYNDADPIKFIKENDGVILMQINKYDKPSTKRNYLNAFIIIYKTLNEDAYKTFSKLRDESHKGYKAGIKTNKDEINGYLSTEQYNEILEKQYEKVKTFLDKKRLNKKQLNDLTDYVILLIYSKYNLRADLTNMLISTETAYKRFKGKKQYNHYILPNKIIINQYKTAKSNGSINISVDNEIATVIKKYIFLLKDYLENPNELYLIYDKNFKSAITANGLTSRFIDIFKSFNKKYNINLNRKRLVSENDLLQQYNEIKEKVEKQAQKSGHSISVATEFYLKK